MTRLLYRLGRASVRRRRLVVVLWLLIAVGTIGAANTIGGGAGLPAPEYEPDRAPKQPAIADREPALVD